MSGESDVSTARANQLSSALLGAFGGGPAQSKREEQELRNFQESLPPAARESFAKLEPKQKLDVMRLGRAFPGLALNDSPLVKMMKDGRLFEKDLGGASPLQRLTEASRPDRPDARGRDTFVRKILATVENPTTSKDAQKEKDADPAESAEFIRKAGDRYNYDETVGRPSHWDDAPGS